MAEKAKALEAALAETGNDYPVPALFVKRWNLLAQPLPAARITTFTSRGHENDPRPIEDLAGFDFTGAGSTFLQLGASGMSIEYASIVDDAGAKARTNAYSITINGNPKLDEHLSTFAQFCLWEIRSTRSSFSVRSAIGLLSDAAHDVPPSGAADHGKHAEADGISLTLKKNGEYSTCEVKEGAANNDDGPHRGYLPKCASSASRVALGFRFGAACLSDGDPASKTARFQRMTVSGSLTADSASK